MQYFSEKKIIDKFSCMGYKYLVHPLVCYPSLNVSEKLCKRLAVNKVESDTDRILKRKFNLGIRHAKCQKFGFLDISGILVINSV